MGDWRLPRRGLTPRERGIPLPYFQRIFTDMSVTVIKMMPWNFPLVEIGASMLHVDAYNSFVLTRLDSMICKLFAWNYRYHRTNIFQKLAPRSIFIVLRKQ
jgi:hypothetical protein